MKRPILIAFVATMLAIAAAHAVAQETPPPLRPAPIGAQQTASPAPAAVPAEGLFEDEMVKKCISHMRIIDSACELFLIDADSNEISLTPADLVSRKLVAEQSFAACPASKDGAYSIEWNGKKYTIKCPVHEKTYREMIDISEKRSPAENKKK